MNRYTKLSLKKILRVFLLAVIPMTGTASVPLTLHDAVQWADAAVLQRAISKAGSLNDQDSNGWTALMYAVKDGNQNSVLMLLKAGASPDIGDRLGRTPLHLAIKAPTEITRLLIKAGADTDVRDAGGITALMLAAGNKRLRIIEYLLEAGARLDLKDYQGNSVLDWARRSNDHDLIGMLEQKLALVEKESPSVADENFAEDVYVDVKFPTWFKSSFLDLNDDLEEAVSAGKRGLMIFISTRRCSYCKAFIQNSLSLADIRQRVQGSFDVVGLEIFDDSEMTDPSGQRFQVKDFVSANKAAFTPTLIFYGAKGKKLLKIVGYYPPDRFRAVLDYLEGQHYLRESLRSYFARIKTASSGSTTKKLITDHQLFSRPPYMLDRRTGIAGQPLLVLFEQPDCDACERFHIRVLEDKPIRRLMREFEAVHLDASDTTTRLMTPTGERMSPAEWFDQLELSYNPAIVFFDSAGKEVMRLDSETQRFRMEGTMQLVLEKGYLKDAQLQRWRRDKAVELYNLRE